jgi:carbonic anhydrase/acetyltransferase-like protein (isoleucine patch superfamily)
MPADVFLAPGARVHGDVTLRSRANVWFGCVVDGTAGPVELDEGANVQDNARVEGVPGQRTYLGRLAAMGHNARVAGAVVEEHALIAIGATVLPGARVGTLSIVAANATVPEGMDVPPRSLVVGQGRIVRQVTDAEIERIHRTGREYLRLAAEYRAQLGEPAPTKGAPP